MHIRNYYRKRMVISVLSVIALVAVVATSAYAIFVTRISNTDDQVITIGDLQITHIEGNQIIDINDIRPMTDSVARAQTNNIYSFSIENTGNLAYHYNISLKNNPNFATNLLPHQFIRFSLNDGETRVLSNYNDAVIFEGILNPGQTHEFTLRIWVGSGNQTDATIGLPNEALGAEIHLKIDIYGRAGFPGETAWNQIVEHNNVREETPDFTTIADNSNRDTQEGLWRIPDEHGNAYVFRGTHEGLNNNVIFAGHQWKILRIEGNGNIRMIYNGSCPGNACIINGANAGTAATIGNSGFNYQDHQPRAIGYMFGNETGTFAEMHANTNNSTIKTFVDNWFNTNIIGANRTAIANDTLFCIDRRFGLENTGTGTDEEPTVYITVDRVSGSGIPSLMCSREEDRLALPVGLINADEVNMAGGRGGITNNDFFLNTGGQQWTMSPTHFTGGSAHVALLYEGWFALSGWEHVGGIGINVRPVLSLNADIVFSSGDGSLANPFIVE